MGNIISYIWTRKKLDPNGAERPNLATKESRLETFNNWPNDELQDPKDLTEAGFFYTGIGDKVQCYYSGCQIVNWEKDDIPILEHAKYFSNCAFVKYSVSDEFLREATEAFENQKKEAAVWEKEVLPVLRRLQITPKIPLDYKDAPELASDSQLAGPMCGICLDAPLTTALCPCGHAVCSECAAQLTQCHVCRKAIQSKMRIYV